MKNKVRLDRWRPHLAAAEREGKSISEYAAGRGLSRHTLYAARRMIRGAGESGRERRNRRVRRGTLSVVPSAFAEVKFPVSASASSTRLEAELPNGAKLALESNEPAQDLLLAALVALSGR